VLDSDWEAEFCRVAEQHPKVIAYTKNHNLGLEVPYRYGSENRKYLPDFIVLIDDGRGPADPLHLVTEIKGYRSEEEKEKKSTMDTYWVPGVNHLGSYGRWAFAEFGDVYQIEAELSDKIEIEFARMIETACGGEFTALTPTRNRSERSVTQQFGHQDHLINFSRAIWNYLEASRDQSLRLSNIRAAAEETFCNTQDALAVLALLSSGPARLLNMEMTSTDGARVSQFEFIQKLSDWWRDKKISDEDWQRWASRVDVKWVPIKPQEAA
jgi:type III restriction enzyme